MDGYGAEHKVDQRVALRMRYLELVELASQGKTKCDLCCEDMSRGNALESWKGNALVFVACLSCLRRKSLIITNLADGMHFETMDAEHSTVAETASLLPSKHRPVLRR